MIPSSLQILSLHEEIYVDMFQIDCLPTSNTDEQLYVERFGAPYSASRAQDILSQISRLYPRLERIIVCQQGQGGIHWTRKNDGRWSYKTEFSLAQLQAEMFEGAPQNLFIASSEFEHSFFTDILPFMSQI